MVVRLLYGDDGRGSLVHVSQAPRGLACGLFCPACGTPLVAKKGAVRVPHLAHDATDQRCVGAVETVTHRLAKEIFRERRSLLLPGLSVEVKTVKGWRRNWEALLPLSATFATVELEAQLIGVRPDALATWGRGEIVIEFRVTNATTSDKLARLRCLGLATVEIDLRKWARWDVDKGALTNAVVMSAPREWLTVPTLFASEMAEAFRAWSERWERRDGERELELELEAAAIQRKEQRRLAWEQTVQELQAAAIRMGIRASGG